MNLRSLAWIISLFFLLSLLTFLTILSLMDPKGRDSASLENQTVADLNGGFPSARQALLEEVAFEELPYEESANNKSATRVVCIPWVPGYDLNLSNLTFVERTVWNSTLIYPEEVEWMWYESWLFKGMAGEELMQKQAYLEQLVRRALTGGYSPEFSRALEEARESNFTAQGWLSDFPDIGDAELVDSINATAVEVENLTRLILLLSERHGVLRALFLISNNRAYKPDPDELAAEEIQLEMMSEELTQKWVYLRELIYRAKYGDYSPEFRSQLAQARASNLAAYAYLGELVEWEDRGLGVYEMLNATLVEIRELTWQLVYLTEKYNEELVLATLASSNGTFVVRGCPPPENPPSNGQHYFYYFRKAGTVWVGCYGSAIPSTASFLGEFCLSTYTTSMSYYWNLAKNYNYCKKRASGQPVPGSQVKSIQIKWFYLAKRLGDSWDHDMIWEGNKNSYSEWYTYAPYTTTYPPNGYYGIQNNLYSLECCSFQGINNYCNTHCYWYTYQCFACDKDDTQHFVASQP